MSNVANVMPLWMAARDLASLLRPSCDRVEVAGSVRRRSQTVHDIEMLVIPRVALDDACALFPEEVNLLDELMQGVERGTVPDLRRPTLDSGRKPPWGPRYKKLLFHNVKQWFVVDLFIVSEETWGAQLAIRTGPADVSHLLVTSVKHGGAMPRGWRLQHGRIVTPDGPLTTRTEEAFFAALDVPCWEPRRRSSRLLKQHLSQR